MSALADAVAEYLVIRRALGFKLERAEKLLGQFVAYCDHLGVDTVTSGVAIAWAQLPAGSSWWYSQRLSVVRCFASWLETRDSRAQVPPRDVFGPIGCPRAEPYLYDDAEVVALMDAAGALRYPIMQATYRCLIGLWAVTGMRVGETIRLDRGDVDWDRGELLVERSKFQKSRLVPLHATTVVALAAYAAERDQLFASPTTPSFFVSSAGTRLINCNVESAFRKMVRLAGLVPRSQRCRPRVHDFRHRFAVLTLLDWHRAGLDVESQLPLLSTVMGHSDPRHTYWYLTGTPELFALAADRLERYEQAARP
jgi:integrase/recombinase XerD